MKAIARSRSERIKTIETGMAQLNVSGADALIKISIDTNRKIGDRVLACQLLGLERARSAVPFLLSVGKDSEDPLLEWTAFWAIGMIGSRTATRPMMRLVSRNMNARKKRAVISALGLLFDSRCENLLANRLLDREEDPMVKDLSAEALGLLSLRNRSEQALIVALSDKSTKVRYSALCAIRTLQLSRAESEVRKLLNDLSVVDGQNTMAAEAADVLVQIRGTSTQLI